MRSTLKITSAMKMVASAKLHKAQLAIGNMLPYQGRLQGMLADLAGAGAAIEGGEGGAPSLTRSRKAGKVAIVAFSSNSSLCGAFNSNIVKETLSLIGEYRSSGLGEDDFTFFLVGKKVSEALRKHGYLSEADYSAMAESPDYGKSAALAQELMDGFLSGRLDRVELVYNHFKSTSSQVVTRSTCLPLTLASGADCLRPVRSAATEPSVEAATSHPHDPEDVIVEPSREELLRMLLPKVVKLRIYTALLDSNAAEHAARTVAMQTATDNGNDLLQELTLEYNKGRQQKITSEILDIVGGSLQ